MMEKKTRKLLKPTKTFMGVRLNENFSSKVVSLINTMRYRFLSL
jgi:hypothetical protein